MGAPDSLDLEAVEVGLGVREIRDEFARLLVNGLLSEVKRLRAERDEVRKAWAAYTAPVPGPSPDDPTGLSERPRPAFVRHMREVNDASMALDRLLGGAE